MITSIGRLEALMVLTCLASWAERKLTNAEFLIPCATMAKTLMHPSRRKHANVMMKILNGENYPWTIMLVFKNAFCSDFGFFRNSEIKTCIRNKTFGFDPYAVPSTCKPGKTYPRSKGYIKIPGDSCVDGDSQRYLPMTLPCPMK
jgi:sortilin-related receptor